MCRLHNLHHVAKSSCFHKITHLWATRPGHDRDDHDRNGVLEPVLLVRNHVITVGSPKSGLVMTGIVMAGIDGHARDR